METSNGLEQVLGTAILSSDFRQKLLQNPKAAAKDLGVRLSDGQVAAIRNLDPELAEWWAQGLEVMRGDVQGFLW